MNRPQRRINPVALTGIHDRKTITAHSGQRRLLRLATATLVALGTAAATLGGLVTTGEGASAATSAPAGSAALGSTVYAAPAGSLYVAPYGNDAAAGTSTAPLRTVTRAINIAPWGATIVLLSGTYHESLAIPANKKLNIESAPHAVVWLDGSSVVTGWTKSGSTWIHTGWTAKFNSTPSYTNQVSTAPYWGFINAAHPMAAHPDQTWINGTALSQVSSAAAVKAGTFYSDYANNRIIIGSDPTGLEVRASDLGIAATISSANSSLRGIGFRRYATAVQDMGAIRVLGANVTVENDVIINMATTGISVLSTGAHINHLTLQYNGMLGMHANYADNVVVSSVLATNNNVEGFNTAPVAGGIKMSRTRNITVRDSILSNNQGSGLWLDESSYNAVVVNNSILNNAVHGFSFEISSTAVIADNVVTGNGSDGLKINDANNIQIWNNTVGSNGRNMELVQDARNALVKSTPGHDPRQPFPDPTMPWKIANIQVMNESLPRGGQYNIYARDYTNARSGLQMGITINGNLFIRTTSTSDAIVVWPLNGGKLTIAHTVAQLAATGAGSSNAEIVSGVPSANAGTVYARPLPAGIAALIGQPAGIRHVGAF